MKAARLYPFAGALLLLLIVLALAGCAPSPSQWSPVEAPRENTVTFLRLSHAVTFAANEERLSSGEAERLGAFLRRQQVGFGDRIVLVGEDTAVSRRRQEAIAASLARGGLRVDAVDTADADGVGARPGEIRILVGRFVVTPPVCGNWSKPPGDDFGNAPSSNFGCATARNLGLMVADPADLLGGRSLSPADGELTAFRVESYRKGEFPSLLRGDASPNTNRKDIMKGSQK
jgi:pilus assembly protein CpaD